MTVSDVIDVVVQNLLKSQLVTLMSVWFSNFLKILLSYSNIRWLTSDQSSHSPAPHDSRQTKGRSVLSCPNDTKMMLEENFKSHSVIFDGY